MSHTHDDVVGTRRPPRRRPRPEGVGVAVIAAVVAMGLFSAAGAESARPTARSTIPQVARVESPPGNSLTVPLIVRPDPIQDYFAPGGNFPGLPGRPSSPRSTAAES